MDGVEVGVGEGEAHAVDGVEVVEERVVQLGGEIEEGEPVRGGGLVNGFGFVVRHRVGAARGRELGPTWELLCDGRLRGLCQGRGGNGGRCDGKDCVFRDGRLAFEGIRLDVWWCGRVGLALILGHGPSSSGSPHQAPLQVELLHALGVLLAGDDAAVLLGPGAVSILRSRCVAHGLGGGWVGEDLHHCVGVVRG